MDEEERELPEIEPLPMESEEPEPLSIEETPISLTDTDFEKEPVRKIQAFGGKEVHATGARHYKRALNLSGNGATRSKIFHCKIAPGSIEYMENQINGWLDEQEVEVKLVTQVVGIMEGKSAEPNLIVMIWY